MKKRFLASICFLIMVISAMGCSFHSSFTYTFNVETGDKVAVKLDTTNGYSMNSEVPFTISFKEEAQTRGTFIYSDYYEEYVTAAKKDPKAKVIKEGKVNGNDFCFWNFDDKEFNCVIQVGNSNTAIILSNIISAESAEKVINALTFTLEK